MLYLHVITSEITRALLRRERTMNLIQGRGGREGGMTVIHILIGMFNSYHTI